MSRDLSIASAETETTDELNFMLKHYIIVINTLFEIEKFPITL